MAHRVNRWGFATCALVSVALYTAPAAAQPTTQQTPDPEIVQQATTLFTTGSDLYAKKSYGEALTALQKSHQLVPSPNSALVIARCLRELGRTAEAAEEFDIAQREAAGNSRYEETAKTAASEGAEVRSKLGTVNVHVLHLPAGGQLLVDGAPVTLAADGYKAFHAPGAVTLTVRAAPSPDVVKSVTVQAGDRADVEIDATPAPPKAARPAWMIPALVGAGAVGVIGLGMAVGFGVSSRSTFNDLHTTCGSNCNSPTQQDQIASGKRNQAIANGTLAVGLAGVAATAVSGVVVLRK
jgi:hypothetical protein